MIGEKLRFGLTRVMWSDHVEFSMMSKSNDGVTHIAKHVIFETLSEKESQGKPIRPFMTLPKDAAQDLMDELWSVGLRPSEGSGSAGSLAATERHLSDMKAIAWHALKIDAKKGGAA